MSQTTLLTIHSYAPTHIQQFGSDTRKLDEQNRRFDGRQTNWFKVPNYPPKVHNEISSFSNNFGVARGQGTLDFFALNRTECNSGDNNAKLTSLSFKRDLATSEIGAWCSKFKAFQTSSSLMPYILANKSQDEGNTAANASSFSRATASNPNSATANGSFYVAVTVGGSLPRAIRLADVFEGGNDAAWETSCQRTFYSVMDNVRVTRYFKFNYQSALLTMGSAIQPLLKINMEEKCMPTIS